MLGDWRGDLKGKNSYKSATNTVAKKGSDTSSSNTIRVGVCPLSTNAN